MGATVTVQLDGLSDALKVLAKVEPDLRKQAPKEFKSVAAPVVNEMKATIPSGPPLSGWRPNGRIGWQTGSVRSGIKTKFRASKNRGAKSREFSLLSIIQTNAAGIIFDMSGRKSSGNSPQGEAMIRNLTSRYRPASRTLWPTLEKNQDKLEAGLKNVVDRFAESVNRKIR